MTLQNTSFEQIGQGTIGVVQCRPQGAPTLLTAAATLTPAQLFTRIISYTGAGDNLTLPLATDLDTALPNFPIDSSFEFTVRATTGTAVVLTNTGWTLVGYFSVAANAATIFRARKTAAGAWTIYQVG